MRWNKRFNGTGNLGWIIHIDRILLTKTRIPCRNLNGFMIYIDGILVYPYWRCSASSSHRKAILAIRSPYTVSSVSFATHPSLLLPKRLMYRSPMIPLTKSVLNGRWTSNTSLTLVIRAICLRNSTNIPWLTRLRERFLYPTIIWSSTPWWLEFTDGPLSPQNQSIPMQSLDWLSPIQKRKQLR